MQKRHGLTALNSPVEMITKATPQEPYFAITQNPCHIVSCKDGNSIKVQVLKERLDEAFLLCQLLWKDTRPLLATECPRLQRMVARKELELDIAVVTVADEIHQVDVDLAKSLQSS